MLNFFYKNLRNKKGFTLVELIVVIAILGILAGIAIPKLGGFTQKAKVAADDQLVSVLTNSVKILVADGTIGNDDGTIEVTYVSNALAYNGTSLTITDENLKIAMDKLVDPSSKMQYYTQITITIDSSFNVSATHVPTS